MLAQTPVPDPDLTETLQGAEPEDWLIAVVVLGVAFLLSRVAKRITERLVERGDSEHTAAVLVGRVIASLFLVAGLVYALAVLEVRLGPLLGALGIGGLAVAFAAQTILENSFASVLLRSRRPFRRGDHICSNDFEGTVENINMRAVVLRTFDNELVFIPCSQVLNNPIVNITPGWRRTTLPVGVSYATDLRQAQQVLLRAAAGVDGVRHDPPAEAWAERFGESSIDFALRFWHESSEATTWRVRSAVALAVKAAFDEAGIEIPFPQRTIGFLPGADRLAVVGEG